MKLPLLTLLAVLGTLVLAPFAEGQVTQVRGYTRKDGTYVPPHTRQNSSRSGKSTFGTTRTRRTSSMWTTPRRSSSYRLRLEDNWVSSPYGQKRSSRTRDAFGSVGSFGGSRSTSALTDYERNLKKASRLRSLGYDAQPYQTWDEMADIERRIRKANRIKKLGMTVDWQSFSYPELKDMERRLRGR